MSFSDDSTDFGKADAAIARGEASIARLRAVVAKLDGDGRHRRAIEAELAEMLDVLEEMRAIRRGMDRPSPPGR